MSEEKIYKRGQWLASINNAEIIDQFECVLFLFLCYVV